MDCVLQPTKAAVLAEIAKHHGSGFDSDPLLRRAAKSGFYNTSPMDLKSIAGDPDNVAGNLLTYLHAFSADVADIFDRFEMPAQIDRLQKAGFVDRQTDPSDRRAWLLYVTPAGMDLLGRLHTTVDAVMEEVLAGFSQAELDGFLPLLGRLRDNLSNSE